MKFSIIIATLNRSDIIEKCIKSVLNQTYDKFEIIIVDQSDDLKTYEISKKYENIIYIKSDKRGLSLARNKGIDAASGEFICLLDDDAEYSSDFLEKAHIEIIKENIIGLCGKVVDKVSGITYLEYMQECERAQISENNLFFLFSSTGLVISREYITKVGKFDEKLGVGSLFGSAEEVDLLQRIMYLNDSIYYIPNILVYHPFENKECISSQKVFNYGMGLGALSKKHICIFNNYKYINKYLTWIIRPLGGIILNLFTSRKKSLYYWKSLKGRIVGFLKYK